MPFETAFTLAVLVAVTAALALEMLTPDAFLNNTPVVAMGIPVTRGWARRNRAKVSRLLMPLSFASSQPSLEARGLVLAVTVASSLALWTPLGYQTNLMVYGPGNYRFMDFVRFGFPLQVLLAMVIVGVVALSWAG